MTTSIGLEQTRSVASRARAGRGSAARKRRERGGLCRPSGLTRSGAPYGLVAGGRWGLFDVPAAAARPVSGAGPRGPEDERENDADESDDHQDPADRVLVDATDVAVDSPDEDGSGSD